MSQLARAIAILAMYVMSQTASAEGAADPGMMAKLQSLYPATAFREVNRTAIKGVFEVVMGQNVTYVDESGRYFLFGRLYDMQKQEDLTAGKASTTASIDVQSLPLGDAIKTVRGAGTKTLYVFSDPDCPYCKQLEQRSLAKLVDVTIYTYLLPLETLHPEAKDKAIAIWCANDNAHAWADFMTTGALPSTGTACANPIDRNAALAARLGVTGTPTLIAGDGRKMVGALSPERLTQWLNGSSLVAAAPERK